MDAPRRAELSQLASGIAANLMRMVPDCEEGAFVAGRVFAMLFANGLDLDDAQARGLPIDAMAASGAMAECVEDVRGILRMRILHEHPVSGRKN